MKFNLITDEWIPVRMLSGGGGLVSLSTLFTEAEAIADLDVRPHERIALMRLLICIAHAAAGIPDDDWESFRETYASAAVDYLKKKEIAPYFELFGNGPRFLQLSVESKTPVSVSKLFPVLASGNNPTVLDHEGGTDRSFPVEILAMGLLVFQNFYPLYGAGYKGRGPCVDSNMLHTFVQGKTLHEAIANNCLDSDEVALLSGGIGKPLWEQFPSGMKDKAAVANATTTYLGRLVPMHRSLRFTDDGSHFHHVKESMEYPPFDVYSREPSSTVVVWGKRGQESPRLLPARLDQAVWRQLPALTVLRREASSGQASAPPVVQCYTQNEGGDLRIWTGAVVTDYKAKILNLVESTFSLPATMFGSGRAIYETGVKFAEIWESRLKKAVAAYGTTLKKDKPSTAAATQHFWNTLDQQSRVLLDVVRHPEQLNISEMTFGSGSTDPWTALVNQAARDAYGHSCPRQTSRHYEAFAAGLRALYPKPKNSNTKEKQPAKT